jgi:hypothetical protein
MSLFYKLNLPQDPLKRENLGSLIAKKKKYSTVEEDLETYLTSEILDIFKSINLRPRFVVYFGRLYAKQNEIQVHRDITYLDNQWKSIPCGINWELTPGDTLFEWYDTSKENEHLPDPEHALPLELNGAHYGHRANMDISAFTNIGSLNVKENQPYLFRTDIPHRVTYKTSSHNRVCISIRFNLNDVKSWEHALEVFDSLIIKD